MLIWSALVVFEGIKKSRPCEVACFFENNVFVFVWFELFDFADYIFVFCRWQNLFISMHYRDN